MTMPAPETLEREKDKIILAAITPERLAKQMGWGAKRVRRLAKKLGACRILGNRMALLPEDVQTILEATKCPSSSIAAKEFGTTGGRLPETDYEARRAQRTAKSRRELRPRSKTEPTNVISMDRKKS
jgi:hypothetical protein